MCQKVANLCKYIVNQITRPFCWTTYCIVLFFLCSILENYTPESIYMKGKCGIKKHTFIYAIYIYIYIMHIIQIHIQIKELCQQVFKYNEKAQCTSHTSCTQVFKFSEPRSHFGENWEGTLFSWLPMCYAYPSSAIFEHFVCHGCHGCISKEI